MLVPGILRTLQPSTYYVYNTTTITTHRPFRALRLDFHGGKMAPSFAPFKFISTFNRTSAFNLPFAFVVLSFSLLATTVAAEDQNQAPAEYTDASAFEDAVLNVTNTYRRQHNATGVVWNSTLEKFAEGWGDDCRFGHSVCVNFSGVWSRVGGG